jgi:YD repeat-containing protein
MGYKNTITVCESIGCPPKKGPSTQGNSGQCPRIICYTFEAGTNTVSLSYKVIGDPVNGNFTSYRGKTECMEIPLKNGGGLSLGWNQFPGNNTGILSVLVDQWQTGGRGGVFSFLPYRAFGFTNNDTPPSDTVFATAGGFLQYNSVGTNGGSITYYETINPLPYKLRYNNAAATYFYSEYNTDTGVYYVYGGKSHTIPGRPLKRSDRNGNTLTYNYRARSPNPYGFQPLLRKITGDTASIIPYFGYRDERGPAPITRISLLDAASVQAPRNIYYDYRNPALTYYSFLENITYPDGCQHKYRLKSIPGFYYGHTGISKEVTVDNGNWATYFDYDPAMSGGANIWRVTEPLGRYTYFNYNGSTNVTTIATNGRSLTYYKYVLKTDAQAGQLRWKRNALGQGTYYKWDQAAGEMCKIFEANNNATYYEYNTLHAVTRKTQGFNGARTYYIYDANLTDLHRQTGPRNNHTYFEYNATHNRIATTDALGNKTSTIRDLAGKVRKIQDARSNTTYFNFNATTGYPVSTRDATGGLSYFRYDAYRNLTRSVSPRWPETNYAGFTTYYEYTLRNKMRKSIDPFAKASYFEYTTSDNLSVATDPNGTATELVYTGLQQLKKRAVLNSADVLQTTNYYEYDVHKNRVVSRDGNNNATYFFYDVLDRVLGVRDALNNTPTYFGYDSVGNRTRMRDSRGNRTTFEYDLLSRKTLRTDALGNKTYFVYDLENNLTARDDARGNRTTIRYDKVNRPNLVTNPLTQRTYFDYDAIGNTVGITNPLALNSYFVYDVLNRITTQRDPLKNSAKFGYDKVGNRRMEQDQRGNNTYFQYDALNRLKVISNPLTQCSYYAYDLVSNLRKTVDANGNATYFVYDALNRRTRIYFALPGYGNQAYGTSPYGAEAVYFEYDAAGNMTRASGGDQGTSTFTHDALNRLRMRKTPRGDALYFNYDSVSNVANIRYPQGTTSAYYVYDANNRARKTVSVNGTNLTTYYTYDADSNISLKRFGNTTTAYYAYDSANRLSIIHHRTSAGAAIGDFVYRRDAAGRIVRILRESSLVVYYQYDDANRLTSEFWRRTSPAKNLYAFSYKYDATGNRLKGYREFNGSQLDTAYFSFDTANAIKKRYVSPAATSTYYSYDSNGSLTRTLEAGSGTYFEYHGNGFISRIVPPSGTPWQFAYDAALARTKINRGGTWTYYLWAGMNQLEERNSAGTLLARYTHGSGIVPGVGSVVEIQRSTATTTYYQYLHMDHQGSVAQVTDASQATQISYLNDAFGRQIITPGGANPNVQNDLVFQSNWMSVTIGTKRYGLSPSRVWDFETGRFVQRDPLPSLQKVTSVLGNSYGIYAHTVFKQFPSLAYRTRAVLGASGTTSQEVKMGNLNTSNGFFGNIDGMNMYSGYFIQNSVDPTGFVTCCGKCEVKLYEQGFLDWVNLVAGAFQDKVDPCQPPCNCIVQKKSDFVPFHQNADGTLSPSPLEDGYEGICSEERNPQWMTVDLIV